MKQFKYPLPDGYTLRSDKVYKTTIAYGVTEDADGNMIDCEVIEHDLVCPFTAHVLDVVQLANGVVFELAVRLPEEHSMWRTRYYDARDLTGAKSTLLREMVDYGGLANTEKFRTFIVDYIDTVKNSKGLST